MENLEEKIAYLEEINMNLCKDYFRESISLYSYLIEKYGEEIKKDILNFRYNKMIHIWSNIALQSKDDSIETLIQTLWEPMKVINGEFTFKEKDGGIEMCVTKCPFADMALEFNETEWGFYLYCMDDYGIMKGFNPNIEFKRTKTLMQGHDCCDHFYRMKKK